MEVAIAGMRADADAARLCKLDRLAHDIGIAGMEAAGDVDRGGKLDHGGVIAHFPWTETFTEIAAQIDCHDVVPAFVDIDLILNLSLPRPRVERIDRRARNISTLQRLDIENGILQVANA